MESKEYAGQCVTLLTTASIQSFVFGTNKLRENVGASWMVRDATGWWDTEGAKKHKAEILFVGGGRAALLFDGMPRAIVAIRAWSEHALRKKPGLRLVAAHANVGEGDYALAAAMQTAQRQLDANENRPPFGAEFGALPVVRNCQVTGRGAVELEEYRDERTWLSRESAAKRTSIGDAKADVHVRYKDALGDFDLPVEFERLGIQEGASQTALIHADGDGVGRRFSALIEHEPPLENRDLHYKLKGLSKRVTQLAHAAFEDLITDVRYLLVDLIQNEIIEEEREFLPIRPLVEAGDDLTFITHGKIGLSLAARYLQHFEQKSQAILGEPATASAGCLIMPAKFPFSRGYALVNELTASAKRKRVFQGEANNEGSWLDFQIILEGSTGSLADIRRSQYGLGSGTRLFARPYCCSSRDGAYAWESFERIWKEFKNTRLWPRSHAKRLMETLARGPMATRLLLQEFASRKRSLRCPPTNVIEGWGDDNERDEFDQSESFRYTPYFDPIEFLDYHTAINWSDHSVWMPPNETAGAAYA